MPLVTLTIFTARPESKVEAVGATCGAQNGSVEIGGALRDVAGGTHAVVGLRPAGVIRSGHEVHIVVAGTAGGTVRIRQKRTIAGARRSALRVRLGSEALRKAMR